MSDSTPGTVDDFDNKSGIHSFIIRVWLELSNADRDQQIWRGHIVHLPSYKQHYFSDINEIPIFIASVVMDQP